MIDAGEILNKESAKSSIETSVLQALGWASYEHVPSSFNLNQNYHIPGIKELPEIVIDFIKSDKQKKPGGIAELPQCLIPSALVSAISQATGCYFDRLPITPEVIYNYLEEE